MAPVVSADGDHARPLLSVCIPTYQRPEGVAAALASLEATAGTRARDVEVIVSDNSPDEPATAVVRPFLERWPGPARHVVHDPAGDMVGNFNACVALATGTWVHILHDDDYLTGEGLAGMVAEVDRAAPGDHVLRFGTHVVDEHGTRRHREVPRRRNRLAPREAVEYLVSDSSSVRFPAMVVRAAAYATVPPFEDAMVEVTDYAMWLRLFERFGFTHVPRLTAAYVVHRGAATTGMFTAQGVRYLVELFARVERTGLVPAGRLRRLRADYFHKFLLAGAIRNLRSGDVDAARRAFGLLESTPVAAAGRSPRWAPLRLAVGLYLGAQDVVVRRI